MSTYKILIIFVIISSYSVFGQLVCYDCDSEDPRGCRDPDATTKTVVCQDANQQNKISISKTPFKTKLVSVEKDIEARASMNEANTTFSCYTILFENNSGGNTLSGIYRGCIGADQGIDQVCDFIKQESGKDGIIKDCDICTFERCNTRNLGGGANNALPISFGIILFNLIICVYVLH